MTAERIVLLGAGRLATHLSRALKVYAPERKIVQIYSPGGHSARRLAESLGGDVQVASSVDELDRTADCYLFAVPDTAIAEVAESLSAHEVGRDALWVHVSGATPLKALSHCHRDAAVLYPLQTFSEGRELDFRRVPLYLEGTTPAAKTAVESLGRELSDVVAWATSEQRQVLHIAAVVACNFSNYLIGRAESLLTSQGLPPKAILPLLDEMNEKLHHLPAVEAQTGPAQRGDRETIRRHQAFLIRSGETELAALYDELSTAIQHIYETI